jgi:fibronectin-binding autotransporter adhesin
MHQRKSVRRFVVANSTLGSPRRFSRTALLSMAAAAVLPAVASATTYQWIGGTGNWGTAANTNWSPTGLPNSGDTANVTNTLGAVQTITYGYAGTAVSLTTLTLDADGGGGTGSETLSMAANNLSAAAEYIGYSNSGSGGKALFNQSGGTNNGTYAYLGVNSTDVGTYLMTGGAYNAPEEIFDGYVGGGVFNASGSANVSCGFINLGDGNGSTGSFSLTGNSSLDCNFGEFIGYFGAGTFNQAGASVNDDNASLYLATVASTSSYELSGSATLNVAGSEFVGDEATATFTQTGQAQHTIAGTLSLASFSGATGTFVLSGGNVTAGEVDIGGLTTAAGRGVMTVNGGTLTTAGILTIYNSAGSGLTLSSGSITAASLNTSGNPSAVNWTGGALTLTAGGIEVDGSSSANLPSGQTIGPTQSLNVQGETIGGTGAGTMTQTGGVNNFGSGSQLIIGGSSSATGSYTLSGSGLLTGTYFDLAYFGSGTYNQSGGVATVTYLNTGYQGNGTATLSGGALNADAEFIGTFTNGTFNQSGGINTISGNAGLTGLFISSTTGTATYNFSGGTALVENGPVVLGCV